MLYRFQAYSGAIAVVILWVGVGTAMQKAGLSFVDQRPLSYLGINPLSSILFSSSLIISSLLFINFAFFVARTFKTSHRFLIYFLTGQAGQLITAITPYGDAGPYKRIHTISAFILAFSLPLLIREFALSQDKKLYSHLFWKLLRLEQIAFAIGIGLFVFTRGIAPLGEALPAAGFHMWVLAVTYVTQVNSRS